ncbi:histidine phosphatase family protein [Paenibacillus macerans]|uniref:histidine phosphatase family protein n=1 Tax=Paenibacillus macerans TaxID=44252 RepID=UPI0020408EE0|nr:histidine phosphatase family protein [Paenibacillus macerans]MCM3700539.1 histidine phosphatase family protein [Paenibacillus macerans]
MKTYIYMVRHGESPKTENNERTRGLTDKGWSDAKRITEILKNEGIDVFVSSPYRRAVLTIEELAKCYDKEILLFEELRELEFSNENRIMTDQELYPEVNKMIGDPDYSLPGGESSAMCMNRAIGILKKIIEENQGKKIVIGTHGLVMTLMMRYFNSKYDFDFLLSTTKPDIYRMEFAEGSLMEVKRIWN